MIASQGQLESSVGGAFPSIIPTAMFDHVEGGVVINDMPSMRVDSMPYGGLKDSGLGREGVRFAMQEMTEPKLLLLSKIGQL